MSSDHTQPNVSRNATLCEQLHALIPAYSFDLADADERAFVEANLGACPEAAAEIASYRQLADTLAQATFSAVPAPPSLRSRVFSALDAPQTPMPMPSPRRAARPRPSFAFAAAMVLTLLLSNVLLFSRLNTLSGSQSSLQQEITIRDQALELLWTGDSERVWLESLAPAAAAEAQPVAAVVWSPQRQNAVLYVRRFPKPANDEAYQLWLTFYGERVSPGTFQVDEQGYGLLVFEPPHPLHSCERMGITREPRTGSDAPTTAPIAELNWGEGD